MPEPALLFVDDEPMMLNSLRHLFDDDYEVLTANSGKKGLELLSKHDVGVIISDQRMPEMLGQ
jgi:YesN/AraC family two-component response regulator